MSENSSLVSNMDLVLTTSGNKKSIFHKHAGEYFRDKIHGFGVYHFPNGHYYEGAWHEGRKQRYGTYGFITGDTECGEWDDGNRLSPETGLLRKAVQNICGLKMVLLKTNISVTYN
ncbi:hypothetical protein YC2023_078538 [Brassica napus]